jgi:ATP-dependent helicase/nuclease subunit B
MLLYLYSCIKNGEELLRATVPAGVLYFPAKRQATDSKSEYIKMSGLLLDEESTLRQMEQSLDGKIIPAHIRPNGSSFYSTESMVSKNAFKIIFKYLEVLLSRIGSSIMRGEITPEPLKVGDKSQCKYCDYRAVCRISPQAPEKQGLDCKNSEALTIIEKEMEKLNGN